MVAKYRVNDVVNIHGKKCTIRKINKKKQIVYSVEYTTTEYLKYTKYRQQHILKKTTTHTNDISAVYMDLINK